MRLLLLPAALFLFPLLLGLPWIRRLSGQRTVRALLCWPLGYFIALAFFEALAVPFTVLRGSFYHFAAAYTALLTLSGALSLVLFLRGRGRKPARRQEKKAFSYWEKLYLLAFLVLAAFTVFRAFTWDTTVMNYDDSEYLTRAADALEHGMLLGVSVTKGMAEEIYLKRATQGFLFFPAWLSWLSGLPVTVSARTVLESTHLLLAYSVYAAMAFTICRKREDGLIFLLLLSLLYLMGHYSHYSPTFRLLGPNYQGKATLAVVFFPLVFTLLMLKLPARTDAAFGGGGAFAQAPRLGPSDLYPVGIRVSRAVRRGLCSALRRERRRSMSAFRDYLSSVVSVHWGNSPFQFFFYLGILLVLLLEKRREVRVVLGWLPLLFLLVIYNPLFGQVLSRVIPSKSWAYLSRLFTFVPLFYVVAHGAVLLLSRLKDGAKFLCVCLLGAVIALSGESVYHQYWMRPAANAEKAQTDAVEMVDLLRSQGENLCVAAPQEVSVYLRQLDANLLTPYGRYVNKLGKALGSEAPDPLQVMTWAGEQAVNVLAVWNREGIRESFAAGGWEPFAETSNSLGAHRG